MIKISRSDRVAIVGTTGSGKTELAKYLLMQTNRCIVIDPKHTFKLDGFKRTWKLPIISNQFKNVIRPKWGEDEKLAEFLLKIYRPGNVTIYCDELPTLADRFPLSADVLGEYARTGREKNISLWCAMQRPRHTPRLFLTESEVFFVFSLRARDDRIYMQGYAGEEVLNPRIPVFSFWYVRLKDNMDPRLMSLDRGRGVIQNIETRKEVI